MNATDAPVAALERQMVVAEALSWMGTRFHHSARVKGAGVDCIQLITAAFTKAGVVDQPQIDFYPTDWFLHGARELLLDGLLPHFEYLADGAAVLAGDLMLFKFGRAISHAAIVVTSQPQLRIIHAYRGAGVVVDDLDQHHAYWVRREGFMRLRRWSALEAA